MILTRYKNLKMDVQCAYIIIIVIIIIVNIFISYNNIYSFYGIHILWFLKVNSKTYISFFKLNTFVELWYIMEYENKRVGMYSILITPLLY